MQMEQKEKKVETKEAKRKRDIQILIGLGVLALIFIVISLTIVLNSNKNNNIPTNTNPSNEQVEETPTVPNEEGDSEVVTEPTEEESNEETNEESTPTEENIETDIEPEEEKATPVESKTYTNETIKITYDIPSSWKGLVDVYEEGTMIEFFYKEDALFLSLEAVTKGEYNRNKDYYDSFYKTALKNDDGYVLYALPNEHPLAKEEGSEAYQELNAIMSDIYNFIQTIKAK